MSLTYTLEGFSLHDPPEGFWILESSNFAPPISPNRVDLQIPHLHGQLPLWDDELQAAKLALRIRITAPDADTLRERWEHLRALMRTGSNRPLNMRRLHGSQILSTFCQLESFDEPDFACAVHMVDSTIMFNIPSGRWTEVLPEEQSVPFTGQFGSTTLDFVDRSTAPVDDVIFRISGTSGTPGSSSWIMFEDVESITAILGQFDVALDGSEYLYMDVTRFTAWRNAADDAWDVDDETNTDSGVSLRAPFQGRLYLTSKPGITVGSRESALRYRRGTEAGSLTVLARGFATYL